MSNHKWRAISKGALVVAVLAALYALFPWVQCTFMDPSAPMCATLHVLSDNAVAWGVSVGAFVVMVVGRLLGRTRPQHRGRGRAEELPPAGGYGGDRRSSESALGPRMATRSRASGGGGVPEAITLSEELDLEVPDDEDEVDEDVDALINFIEDGRDEPAPSFEAPARPRGRRSKRGGAASVDGFYCPPGLDKAPVLYVDPTNAAASDAMDAPEERADNPERPFVTIQAALDRAQKLFMTTRGPVQVRVTPGVYQEKLFIPGHVVLVNHRLPAEGSIKQHLQWLVEQEEVGHPDRVTILAPADAEFAVKFERGQNQGIFGCHLVGREGVRQQGIVAEHCQAMAVVHCSVEDFAAGGIHLVDSGAQLAKTAVQVVGCRLRNNRGARGGAIFCRGGSLRVEKTRFEHNHAAVGGAVFAIDLGGTLEFEEVGFRKNVADAKDRLTVRPDVVELSDWLKGPGQGGALAVVRSKTKMTGCKFLENRAKISGGALALLGAQAVVGEDSSFKKNEARVGGAVFMAGWTGSRCTLKASGAKFVGNTAGSDGGGVAVLGTAVAQIVGARFEQNKSEDAEGVGGAVASLKGGQFMAKETRFRANETLGRGGAAGAINASLVFSDGCSVEENTARGGNGGGLFCLSRADAEMEELMNRSDFKLPFVFTVRDVAIRRNRATGATAGVWAGNKEHTPTFPLKVTLEKPMFVTNNQAAKGGELSRDFVVQWTGQVIKDSKDRRRCEELLN